MSSSSFPNFEGKISVLRRYLHILALLQYIPHHKNAEMWNAGKLADLLSRFDADKPLDDSQVRKYIKDYIEEELGIDIDKSRGKKSMSIAEDLDFETQLMIARIYSNFVIKDTSRDIALSKYIKAMPDRALWTLARIYFAVLEKRVIQFDYTRNDGKKIRRWKMHPFYFVFRETNLYLAGHDPAQGFLRTLFAERIENLVILDELISYDWPIPSVDEFFRSSLSAFKSISGPVSVTIRFKKYVSAKIENLIAPLEPIITASEKNDWFDAEFIIDDDLFLCEKLFSFGGDVEILSPPILRTKMMNMLKASMKIYE